MVTNCAKIKLLVLFDAFVRTNFEKRWRKRLVLEPFFGWCPVLD